jgi:hypothetical protein
MLNRNQKKDLLKTILSGFAIWFVLVLIVYLFSGNFSSVYVIGIIVFIATIRFVIPDYIKFKKRNLKNGFK